MKDVDWQSDFVDRVVSDAGEPPEVLMLVGYPGKSSKDNHRRLYADPELSVYADIPADGILFHRRLPDTADPLGAIAVWVKKDARIAYCVTDSVAGRSASYCCGPIQSEAEQQASCPPEAQAASEQLATFRPTCAGKYTCTLCAQVLTFRPTCWGKYTCAFCAGEELSGTFRPTCWGKYTCSGCSFVGHEALSTFRPTCAGKYTCPCPPQGMYAATPYGQYGTPWTGCPQPGYVAPGPPPSPYWPPQAYGPPPGYGQWPAYGFPPGVGAGSQPVSPQEAPRQAGGFQPQAEVSHWALAETFRPTCWGKYTCAYC